VFRLLIILPLLFNAPAPRPAAEGATCEERARQVLQTLPESNDLRYALAQGARGDCVRRPWMDGMKRFGVKHASFHVRYTITKDKMGLKVEKVFLLRDYYQYGDAHLIKDKRVRREIKESGLERQLREAVLDRLKKEWAASVQDRVCRNGGMGDGTMEGALLDDEALPVIDHLF